MTSRSGRRLRTGAAVPVAAAAGEDGLCGRGAIAMLVCRRVLSAALGIFVESASATHAR